MQPYVIVPSQGSDQTDEWLKLGVEAQAIGNLPRAQQHYQQALRLDPRNAIATQNLAIVFAQSNLLSEAILTIERASMLDGEKHSLMQMNWGLIALEMDQLDLALEKTKKAVEIAKTAETLFARAMVLGTAGLPDQAIEIYKDLLKIAPSHPAAGSNICFAQTLTLATPKDLLEQRQIWRQANRYHGPKIKYNNEKNFAHPLRVGYVSGDFKTHSASMIFRAVVLHHTPDINLFLYSTLPVSDTDVYTQKFKAIAGTNWRDISALDDEKSAELIIQDKIDILVDLAAHTGGGRLTLFTRKPAPVQVTGWGFAHGTGCPEIDYFFADPTAIPQEERQYYAEKIYDLPCLVTYDPPVEYQVKESSLPPLRKNGYVTFGTYARYEKLSDLCLETFRQILEQVPDSKLEFKDHGFRRPYAIRRIQKAMQGIAEDRLLFSLSTSHQEHMLAYQQSDLILDPFPHCGGVVGLEQLYMGVPIVTLYGTQPAGRNTSSVLTAIGKADWIARSREEYVEKAVAWANDPKRMADARKTLRAELLSSPVIVGYVQAVEEAYRKMWKAWCEQ